MTESQLKSRIFWILFAVKAISFFYAFIFWGAGFTTEQFIGLCSLLSTLLGVYLAVSYEHILKDRFIVEDSSPKNKNVESIEKPKLLKKSFVRFVYLCFFIYLITIITIISLRTQGSITSYEQMQTIFSLVETSMGIYLTGIMDTLFKKEKESEAI